MAQELFSRKGLAAFYACVAAYLYGDLAIYAVGTLSRPCCTSFTTCAILAIPKSLREVICPRPSSNAAVWECPTVAMNSAQLYRILVVVFGVTLGSFAFGHMQKTQCIQLITTIMRHASFALMIILAFVGIGRGQGRPVADVVAHEDITSLPNFFGVCIYSFMCHHSIPGIIAPISKKRSVGLVLLYAFIVRHLIPIATIPDWMQAVMFVYVILSISATFRFQPADIQVQPSIYCWEAHRGG